MELLGAKALVELELGDVRKQSWVYWI